MRKIKKQSSTCKKRYILNIFMRAYILILDFVENGFRYIKTTHIHFNANTIQIISDTNLIENRWEDPKISYKKYSTKFSICLNLTIYKYNQQMIINELLHKIKLIIVEKGLKMSYWFTHIFPKKNQNIQGGLKLSKVVYILSFFHFSTIPYKISKNLKSISPISLKFYMDLINVRTKTKYTRESSYRCSYTSIKKIEIYIE